MKIIEVLRQVILGINWNETISNPDADSRLFIALLPLFIIWFCISLGMSIWGQKE